MVAQGDACPVCLGRGDVRVKGRPAGERVPCPNCGGRTWPWVQR